VIRSSGFSMLYSPLRGYIVLTIVLHLYFLRKEIR